jgi:hypothetical protein
MLNFNEGKACEAIVRRLEEREAAKRSNMRWPEQEQHKAAVEIAFNLGNQLIALEHAGIEPFPGHVQMEAQSKRLYSPITDALKDALGKDALYELCMPVNALGGRKAAEVQPIQNALIDWVKTTAPTVQRPDVPDYRGHAVGPAKVPGVPFEVTLARYEPAIVPGRYFQIRHLVQDDEKKRTERMQEAVTKKFPKLAAWKKETGAKTILVLEQNDIQLTNQAIVADAFVPLAKARADRPDETYLVASCMDPWYVWPILIGDRSYFDIAKSDELEHWEFDPAKLTSLTKR